MLTLLVQMPEDDLGIRLLGISFRDLWRTRLMSAYLWGGNVERRRRRHAILELDRFRSLMLYMWILYSSAMASRLTSAFREVSPGSEGNVMFECSCPHSTGWPAAHVAGLLLPS